MFVCACVFRVAWGLEKAENSVVLMTVRICSFHLRWKGVKGTLQAQNLGLNLLAPGPLAAFVAYIILRT